jgi:Fe-S oxidoreductase
VTNLQTIPGAPPVYEDYSRCIHRGLCLNDCPTYRLWHLEGDSPRGRIRQIALVQQGTVPISDTFVDHMDKCLACRACETSCASGIEYGLIEYARARIEKEYQRPFFRQARTDSRLQEVASLPLVVRVDQLCCGALAAHAGVREAARELARNFAADRRACIT